VRSELTKMADENRIRLAGWDGRRVRPLAEWRNREEFVENAPEGYPVRVSWWSSTSRGVERKHPQRAAGLKPGPKFGNYDGDRERLDQVVLWIWMES